MFVCQEQKDVKLGTNSRFKKNLSRIDHKARLHRRFFDAIFVAIFSAIFVAVILQLKIAFVNLRQFQCDFDAICLHDIANVSHMSEI